jgi:hypothetical protein
MLALYSKFLHVGDLKNTKEPMPNKLDETSSIGLSQYFQSSPDPLQTRLFEKNCRFLQVLLLAQAAAHFQVDHGSS